MKKKHRRLTVLLVGATPVAYRKDAILTFLAKRPGDYAFTCFEWGYFDRMARWSRRPLRMITLFLHLLAADVVIVMPMAQMHAEVPWVARLARWFRREWWIDWYMSFYETDVFDRKKFPEGSEEATKRLVAETEVLKSVSRVVFLNEGERRYYEQVFGFKMEDERCLQIPLTGPHRPMALTPGLREAGRPLHMVWWGRIGNPLHGLEEMVAGLALARKSVDAFRVTFACAGHAKDVEGLRTLVRNAGLADLAEVREDLTFTDGSLERFLVEEADLALGIFGKTGKAQAVMANKVIDAMAFGLPCITEASAAVRELVSPGVDVLADNYDTASLAREFVACVREPARLAAMKEPARARFASTFSPEKFEELLQAALAGVRRGE